MGPRPHGSRSGATGHRRTDRAGHGVRTRLYVQDFWHQHAVRVDCVVPFRVKHFRQSYQSHTKTDRLDAFILAKYAHTYRNLLYPAIIPTDDRLGVLRDSIKEVWGFSRDLGSVEKRAAALVDQWIPEWGTIAPFLHQANGIIGAR